MLMSILLVAIFFFALWLCMGWADEETKKKHDWWDEWFGGK